MKPWFGRFRLLMAGILAAWPCSTTAEANEAYDYARSLSDYDRAAEFARIANEAYPTLDPCVPSHTEFLGMKPDERAGYLLVCSDQNEILIILHADRPNPVTIDPCWEAASEMLTCREWWDGPPFWWELED